jgi:hypothetical protein
VHGTGTGAGTSGARIAMPTLAKTYGMGVRVWLPNLAAANNSTASIAFRDNSNTTIAAIQILTNGQISVRNNETGGGTLYGTTTAPVITAGAWTLIEWKVFSDASAGTIDLKVNNSTKLTLTGLNTGGNDIAQIHLGAMFPLGGDSSVDPHYKDLVIWDTTGTHGNNFLGNVAVHDLYPDGDVSGGWVPTFGTDEYAMVRDEKPAGTLTASGAISDGDTVKIDTTYYRFSSGSLDSGTPAGTSGNPWRVLIAGTVEETLENLHLAVSATGVAGTDYSTALTAHTTVDSMGWTDTQYGCSAKLSTASAISTTETGANLAWAASTLTDGPTDTSYISADNTPPAAAIMTMTDLPEDVISVKAVIPIGRMLKTDGGDCTVMMSVSPNSVDYDDGVDREITVAPTYWWDVSHVSPDTGSAWTPDEVNDMVFKIDRTT